MAGPLLKRSGTSLPTRKHYYTRAKKTSEIFIRVCRDLGGNDYLGTGIDHPGVAIVRKDAMKGPDGENMYQMWWNM
jgi:hypothetical protein